MFRVVDGLKELDNVPVPVELRKELSGVESKFLDLQDKYLHLEGESLALETALEIFEDRRDEISVLQDVLLETDEEEIKLEQAEEQLSNVRKQAIEMAAQILKLTKSIHQANAEIEKEGEARPEQERMETAGQWYDGMAETLLGVSGVSVVAIKETHMHLTVEPRVADVAPYNLYVNLDPQTRAIASWNVVPDNVPIADLLSSDIKKDDHNLKGW